MSKAYTDEFLISELHRFVREKGKVPKYGEMSPRNGYPSIGAYRSHFGTHNNALEMAKLPLNQYQNCWQDGTEVCCKCGNYLKQGQSWHTKGLPKGEVMCQRCYDNIHTDYMNGNLDINSSPGRGRAGEILVVKTLGIGKEHDCNLIKWGHKVDLIHKEYKKIDVKTSLLSDKYNKWAFGFNAKKVVDTYICVGLSLTGKYVRHIWVVPNENEIRNKPNLSIYGTFSSIYDNKHWEVDSKPYSDVWQEMIVNYQNDECEIFK